MNGKTRVQWVDTARGIGILLVIAGHTVNSAAVRGPIFSIHMPLFFILSAYASHFPENKEALLRQGRTLLSRFAPLYGGLYLLRALTFYVLSEQKAPLPDFLRDTALALVMGSGVRGSILGFQYQAVGMVWFFPVLVLGRLLYGALRLWLPDFRLRGGVCLALALLGMTAGTAWPLSLDLVLVAVFFLFFGDGLKGVPLEDKPLRRMAGALLAWACLLAVGCGAGQGYLELAARRYPLLPVSLICALCGSSGVILACFQWERRGIFPRLQKALAYLGEHALLLLCIHYLDALWSGLYAAENPLLSGILRMAVDVSFLVILGKGKNICRERSR